MNEESNEQWTCTLNNKGWNRFKLHSANIYQIWKANNNEEESKTGLLTAKQNHMCKIISIYNENYVNVIIWW